MNPNPSKSPNAENEEKILNFWREQNIFQKVLDKESPMGDYVFFEGPPTANGRPGIHHVLARSFKDIIPRYKTMRGFHVRRKAGWDTHGLPVELQVEKQLGLKSKKEIEEFGVAEFNKRSRASVWEYKDEWEKLTERMGYWLDMQHPYVTYDNSYIEALWGTVKKISERSTPDGKSLLYRDFRVGPWCARCGTGLSSHELNQPGAYKDVKDLSVFAKFKVENPLTRDTLLEKHFDRKNYPIYFIAWTTTPWTLPGNTALAINQDEKYVLIDNNGKEGLVVSKKFYEDQKEKPDGCFFQMASIVKEGEAIGTGFSLFIDDISGSELVHFKYKPIFPYLKDNIPEDQKEKIENAFKVYAGNFVTTTDGTGIVHIAPMYGQDDFDLGNEYSLPKFHTVNEEGKFIKGTDFLEGRYVKEVDENGKPTLAVDIIDYLKKNNLFFKQENIKHSYPHCWRCDTPLIYYARTSWYFRMSALREQMLEANKTINWEPDHIRDGRFGEWLDGIKDWAISRDRYWGTPLPVWQNTDGTDRVVIGSVDELKKYTGDQITKIIFVRHGEAEHNVLKMSSSAVDKHPLTEKGFVQAEKTAHVLVQKEIDVVYASPILRAKQTAEAYIKLSNKKIIFDDRLKEIASGNWEEKSQLDPDIKSSRDAYKALDIESRYVFKRGETGESWQDMDVRTKSFLDEVVNKHAGKTIVIFSHQGTGSSMIKQLKNISNQEAVDTIFHNETITGNAVPVTMYVHTESGRELDLHKPIIDNLTFEKDGVVYTRTSEVMDVWFDSGAMPMAQDHKLGEPVNFDPVPADYISEGVDQTRGWFYTMHAIANLLHDYPTQAYKNVVCLGLVLDANGQKMSKSRGNVVNPWDMFDKYGADVVRFWFYSVNQPGEFKNFDEKSLDEVNKKTFNILRNIVSFYEMYAQDAGNIDPYKSENVLDQWILALWNQTLEKVITGMEQYQVLEPSRAIREFITELSQWYIRRSRDRFKSDDGNDKTYALAATKYILGELVKTMAPFTPFIAEEIWMKLGNTESVHLESYPVPKSYNKKILIEMDNIRKVISMALEMRSTLNIKVRQPLQKLTIMQELLILENRAKLSSQYELLIKEEVNVKEVVIGEYSVLDTEITDALRDEGDMRELIRAIQDMRKQADLVPSDRVVVLLTQSQPAWFDGELGQELLQTVGAESVVWGGGEDKVKKI